jgi:hypothetical protein
MHNDIQLWFLIVSLFWPGLTLLLAWIFGGMPAHVGVPFPICLIGAIFFSRPLILVFIAMNLGIGSGWFIIHAIVCFLSYFIWLNKKGKPGLKRASRVFSI